jgi:hypothetical protein
MIGSSHTVGVEIFPGGVRIVLLAMRPSPTVVKCEEIALAPGDAGKLGTIVSTTLDRLGAKRSDDIHLAFSSPSGLSRHQILATPKMNKAELQALAGRELKKEGSLDISNALYSIEEIAGDDLKRNLLVALQREQVEQTATMLLANKRRLRSATTAPMALFRAASVATVPQDAIVALALLDTRRSSLLVLDKGVPRLFRDIPTFLATREGADETVSAQALARELDLSLVYFAQQNRPKQVDTLVIVGAPGISERVSEWAEEAGKYRVVRFGAGPKLGVASGVTANLAPFAVAIGAALGPKVREIPNVLPTELRSKPEQAYALTAACFATVLFLGAIYLRRTEIKLQRDKTDEEVQQARSRFDSLKAEVKAAELRDQQERQALAWTAQFEQLDNHRAVAQQLVQHLSVAMQPKTKVSVLSISELNEGPSKATPGAASVKSPNLRLAIEGLVRDRGLTNGLANNEVNKVKTNIQPKLDVMLAQAIGQKLPEPKPGEVPQTEGIVVKSVAASSEQGATNEVGIFEMRYSIDARLLSPIWETTP